MQEAAPQIGPSPAPNPPQLDAEVGPSPAGAPEDFGSALRSTFSARNMFSILSVFRSANEQIADPVLITKITQELAEVSARLPTATSEPQRAPAIAAIVKELQAGFNFLLVNDKKAKKILTVARQLYLGKKLHKLFASAEPVAAKAAFDNSFGDLVKALMRLLFVLSGATSIPKQQDLDAFILLSLAPFPFAAKIFGRDTEYYKAVRPLEKQLKGYEQALAKLEQKLQVAVTNLVNLSQSIAGAEAKTLVYKPKKKRSKIKLKDQSPQALSRFYAIEQQSYQQQLQQRQQLLATIAATKAKLVAKALNLMDQQVFPILDPDSQDPAAIARLRLQLSTSASITKPIVAYLFNKFATSADDAEAELAELWQLFRPVLVLIAQEFRASLAAGNIPLLSPEFTAVVKSLDNSRAIRHILKAGYFYLHGFSESERKIFSTKSKRQLLNEDPRIRFPLASFTSANLLDLTLQLLRGLINHPVDTEFVQALQARLVAVSSDISQYPDFAQLRIGLEQITQLLQVYVDKQILPSLEATGVNAPRGSFTDPIILLTPILLALTKFYNPDAAITTAAMKEFLAFTYGLPLTAEAALKQQLIAPDSTLFTLLARREILEQRLQQIAKVFRGHESTVAYEIARIKLADPTVAIAAPEHPLYRSLEFIRAQKREQIAATKAQLAKLDRQISTLEVKILTASKAKLATYEDIFAALGFSDSDVEQLCSWQNINNDFLIRMIHRLISIFTHRCLTHPDGATVLQILEGGSQQIMRLLIPNSKRAIPILSPALAAIAAPVTAAAPGQKLAANVASMLIHQNLIAPHPLSAVIAEQRELTGYYQIVAEATETLLTSPVCADSKVQAIKLQLDQLQALVAAGETSELQGLSYVIRTIRMQLDAIAAQSSLALAARAVPKYLYHRDNQQLFAEIGAKLVLPNIAPELQAEVTAAMALLGACATYKFDSCGARSIMGMVADPIEPGLHETQARLAAKRAKPDLLQQELLQGLLKDNGYLASTPGMEYLVKLIQLQQQCAQPATADQQAVLAEFSQCQFPLAAEFASTTLMDQARLVADAKRFAEFVEQRLQLTLAKLQIPKEQQQVLYCQIQQGRRQHLPLLFVAMFVNFNLVPKCAKLSGALGQQLVSGLQRLVALLKQDLVSESVATNKLLQLESVQTARQRLQATLVPSPALLFGTDSVVATPAEALGSEKASVPIRKKS